mmetsp:Transcript_6654/g.18519  ORF Transcript_6654/g.18519 Transcript_6654/m.18519 type:complete len:280 (+) Transcript_6654:2553-3392(+)
MRNRSLPKAPHGFACRALHKHVVVDEAPGQGLEDLCTGEGNLGARATKCRASRAAYEEVMVLQLLRNGGDKLASVTAWPDLLLCHELTDSLASRGSDRETIVLQQLDDRGHVHVLILSDLDQRFSRRHSHNKVSPLRTFQKGVFVHMRRLAEAAECRASGPANFTVSVGNGASSDSIALGSCGLLRRVAPRATCNAKKLAHCMSHEGLGLTGQIDCGAALDQGHGTVGVLAEARQGGLRRTSSIPILVREVMEYFAQVWHGCLSEVPEASACIHPLGAI